MSNKPKGCTCFVSGVHRGGSPDCPVHAEPPAPSADGDSLESLASRVQAEARASMASLYESERRRREPPAPSAITWRSHGPVHVAAAPGGLLLMVDEPPPGDAETGCIWLVRVGDALGVLLAHGERRSVEHAQASAEERAHDLLAWAETLSVQKMEAAP